ncbi:5-hydroxytryptamine receptor 1-like [Solea senegalensis]|uniref:5-hydroxytryptamine receptor 1-like n=1 Tax=Solea senegalensis TaxID=28829 RepID=A0AAV6S256_SOLSE|nr:5-hydroxytryptamine receptor 1-like [Solea senegalensis]
MDVHVLWNESSSHGGDAHTDSFFLFFNSVVLSLTLVLGFPGNLWVCWVVFRTKSLQTSNNALLVSLATSDLLKCTVDTPLLLFSLLHYGRKQSPVREPMPVPLCTVQQFTYALCSCVQLLTLVGISVERFQAIAFPFQTERRRARVQVWILSIWACGLVLAVTSLTLSEDALLYLLCRSHVLPDERPLHSDPFGAFVLVPVWLLCISLIVVHYVRIFKIVRQHRKKVINHGVHLRPTVSEHVWAWMSVPPHAAAARTHFKSLPSACYSSGCVLPRHTVLLVAEAGTATAGGGRGGGRGGCVVQRPSEIVGAVCLMTPGARERGKKHLEGKMALRFGYIIVAFTLFWLPLVVVLLVNVSARRDSDRLLLQLETSGLVLTCMQAAVDPLIYTLVTRQFRSELSKILSSFSGCPQNQTT